MNECSEELGTRVNLSKLHLNLNFQETISHADDLRYAWVKVRELEKHILEHEWQEKKTQLHTIVILFCTLLINKFVYCSQVSALYEMPRVVSENCGGAWEKSPRDGDPCTRRFREYS